MLHCNTEVVPLKYVIYFVILKKITNILDNKKTCPNPSISYKKNSTKGWNFKWYEQFIKLQNRMNCETLVIGLPYSLCCT